MGCTQSAPDKGAEGGITNSSQDQIDGQEAAQAAAMVLGSADMGSQVELKFGCRHLPKMDTLSKSDPVVILYQSKPGKTRDWHEVGRTEVIQNTHDPDFTTSVVMRYTFEAMQPLKVVVYDVDTPAVQRSSDLDLSRQEYIGETTFFLSSVMTAPSQRLERQLSRSSDHPRLTLSQACCVVVTAEEMSQAQATVHLAFSAKNLDNVERFSKSDPFLRVLRLREGGDWLPVLKTEVKDNNLDPVWQPIEVDIRQLCNADGARPLRIEVLDYENNGSHRLLGECQTSLDQLLTIAASPSPMVDLVNPKKSGRKGYQNSGVLVVRSATVKPRPSFLQYITGGCQLNFAVAIDFTGSNGDPRMPSSLHFLSPAPTMYEEAIKAVGGVLEHYDTDKLFPVWGFGAALPPSFTVSHCFAVGGSPGQPEVEGVQGILRAYRDTLPTLKLSGPTLFSPVVTAAANMARQAAAGPGLGYIVLLIITDGCIMDMDQTKEAIVEASGLPLSLLIVGVGDADFDAMEVLDGDKEPVSYKGRVAQRDIVQFVPLKATLREKGGMQAIAQELLAEIPGQVVGYFHGLRGILPRGGGPPSAPPMGGWH